MKAACGPAMAEAGGPAGVRATGARLRMREAGGGASHGRESVSTAFIIALAKRIVNTGEYRNQDEITLLECSGIEASAGFSGQGA